MPKSQVGYNGSNFCAGNVNMKGKKYKLMRCGCCACLDMRDDVLKKEHEKEMKNWSEGLYHGTERF